MRLQDVMSREMIYVEPDATLREAARRMSEHRMGAALVSNSGVGSLPGIITERDILNAIAEDKDPDRDRVVDNSTASVVTVPDNASVERAVERMMVGTFRHLLVVNGDDVVGIISMRDLMGSFLSRWVG